MNTGEPEILIDQRRIKLADFPRGEYWWERFLPVWVDVTVRPDKTVVLRISRYSWWDGRRNTAGQRHRSAAILRDWLARTAGGRFADAVIEVSDDR